MENDILTKEELINYLYFVFTKDRQSIEKFNDKYKYNFNDNLYIKKSTNKSVKQINNTLDEEFINLAKDNSEYRETLFCIDILIKLIYKYNFNINIFEESKRVNVIDIYKFYTYNSLKNESKEFCCFDSNDIRKRFIRLNMVDCFKGATIDLYIGFLDLLLLKEIIDYDIHKKEVESFYHNLDILINEIPNLKIYEYNENPLSLINRIVYPQIKQSELFNNTNEPTKTQEVVSDEHEEIYKEIQKKLNNYISYDGVEKYKTIIQYKINSTDFSNIDGRCFLVMKSGIDRDILRFTECFNLTRKEAEKIFKTKDKKPISLNPKDSVSINMLDPSDFEKVLIEVRNEHLNKINPKKFKLI